jgi:hypothetical protein
VASCGAVNAVGRDHTGRVHHRVDRSLRIHSNVHGFPASGCCGDMVPS